MKSKYLILALIAVIFLSCAALVVFSLERKAEEDDEDSLPDTVADVPGDDESRGNGKDDSSEDDSPVDDGGKATVPADPDEAVIETSPVDELLNSVSLTQRRLLSFKADVIFTHYGGRHDIAVTHSDKQRAGDTSRGSLVYKPGNKCRFVLKGEDGERRFYAYMHSLWDVDISEDGRRATRYLIGEKQVVEVLLILQGCDPEALKKIFDVELLDISDTATRKILGELGYEDKDLPPKFDRRREILKFTYRDGASSMRTGRIDVVVGFMKAKIPGGKTEEVPVIEMLKIYGPEKRTSTPAHPTFKEETIVRLGNIAPDFVGDDPLPEDTFRFDPKSIKDIEVVDYVMRDVGGVRGVLGRMRRTPAFIRGFYSRYDLVRCTPEPERTSAGEIWYVKPECFKMKTSGKDEDPFEFAANGKVAYFYRPLKKEATIFDVARQAKKRKGLPGNIEMFRYMVEQNLFVLESDFDFKLEDELEKMDGRDVFHLKLTRKASKPRAASEPIKECTLKLVYTDKVEIWVDVETFLVLRTRAYDEYKPDVYEDISFTGMQTEREIGRDVFDVPKFPDDVEQKEG